MELNFNKCKHKTFYRSFKLDTSYHFEDKILEKVLNITDLGILLDHKLTFSEHISMMVNKVNGVLELIKRWSKEFTDPYVTKQLYMSLVRSVLEYGIHIFSFTLT